MITDLQLSTGINYRRMRQKFPSARRVAKTIKLPLLLTALHIPLGIALYNSSALAVLHPYAVFFLGLYWAAQTRERLEKIACVSAYLIGAEVLWRMAQSPIFWEFGKYGAGTIMIVALVKRGNWKIPALPLLYFVFLLPSCLLSTYERGIPDVNDKLSFNMSGPLLILISCWFFSYLKITPAQLKKLFLFVIIPLTSVAVTTLFYTVTNENIQFGSESNFATSGGFGPNQVSAMLGLGAFFCLSGCLLFKNNFKWNLYFGLLAIFFTAQSVLTFSRGGMYNAVGALLTVIIVQMRKPSDGFKRLLPVLGLGAFFLLLVFPYLNNFTGGTLQERFEEQDSTNRVDIIESDLQVFTANPIFGVGVGESMEYRKNILGYEALAHTEFSRTISEHGTFGVFAIAALVLTASYNFSRQKSMLGKALAAGVVVWGVLFMLNAGMRLAAPSFVFGLSAVTITALSEGQRIHEIRGDKTRRTSA